MGRSKKEGGMGFRVLIIFNQALLAKQVWRLYKSPSSLTARILKAKYFPYSSVMEVSIGTKPSFAWRIIISSLPLLQQGIVWRVGDGHSIRVWQDRWLPTPNTFMVQSPKRLLGEDALVSNLIDPNTKEWKTDFIKEVFLEDEAHAMSLPIFL